jgi:beta-ureidopropionase / N-carbamoyl-L-amino-acid hydrolase
MQTRRAFLGTLATSALAWSVRHTVAAEPQVDAAALRSRLEALSVFGRPEGGTFADGVSRVAYSPADVQGREYVISLMRRAQLDVRIDPAGNIFGRRRGRDESRPPILFGSHIDSVPSGGNFDGDLGSLAALGSIEALDAAGVQTAHPLEMVVWAHEEGVAFGRGLAGSRIVAGDIKPGDLDQVWNGMTRAQGIRAIGGDPARLAEAVRRRGSFHCYLELHIEQGGTLDRAGVPIGVVEGIVAIDRYDVVVTGFANHAGTTPMNERQDALIAAARLSIAVREIVTREPGRHVGTVGRFEVAPNAPNVIPGSVKMTIELRDLSPEKLKSLAQAIRVRAAEIQAATNTRIELSALSHNPPAAAASDVQSAIERSAAGLRLESRRLPSGAGHDAQMMAQLGPMGMIFVPSIGGISHSPKELTSWEDCARGADALLRTILDLDEV